MALALFLALGFLPGRAMAATVGSYDQIEKDSALPVYYGDNTGALDAATRSTDGSLTTADGKVTTKTAIAGTDRPNVFELTLDITTRDDSQTTTVMPDSAVVLVVDLSSSMDGCLTCGMPLASDLVHRTENRDKLLQVKRTTVMYLNGVSFPDNPNWATACFCVFNDGGLGSLTCRNCYGTKDSHNIQLTGHEFKTSLAVARESANQFVTDYVADAGSAKRLINIITYARGYFGGSVTNGWMNASTQKDAVIAAINGLTETDWDTNTAKGMQRGKDALNDSALNSITNKSLVLLTDGQPSPFGGDNGSTWGNYLTSADRTAYPSTEYLSPIGYAREIQSTGGSVYSICYGPLMGSGEFAWLSHFSNKAYEAKDAASLKDAFQEINQTIHVETQAAEVTIPLDQFLAPTAGMSLPKGMTFDENTHSLSWTLDKVGADNNQERHYSTTFSLTLDTAAQDFTADVWLAVNPGACLTYVVKTDSSTSGASSSGVLKAYFRVPQVKGSIPEAKYTIEFYQYDKAKGEYVLTGTPEPGSAPIWTKIDAPDGYASKFMAAGYTFGHALVVDYHNPDAPGNATAMTLREGENSMKLYYIPTHATVTVYGVPVTAVVGADGTASYAVDAAGTAPLEGYPSHDYDVNDTGVNLAYPSAIKGGAFQYVSAIAGTSYVSDKVTGITITGVDTKFNLYYLQDERATATAQVNHIYNTPTWDLVNGKYTLTDHFSAPVSAESVTGAKAYDKLGVSLLPKADYASYTYTGYEVKTGTPSFANVDDKTASLTLGAGANEIDLIFTKAAPETPAVNTVTVTVNHHYDKRVTTVDPATGAVVTDSIAAPNSSKPYTVYVGEDFTVTELFYTPDATGTYSLKDGQILTVQDVSPNGAVINVDYVQYAAPTETSATVLHVYRTWHNVGITADDDTYTGFEIVEDESKRVTLPADGQPQNLTGYVGQAGPTPEGKSGYKLNVTDSAAATTSKDGRLSADASGNVFVFYYDNTDILEDRDAADMTVTHSYLTHVSVVEDGKITVKDVPTFFTDPDPANGDLVLNGRAGDSFTPTVKESYNGISYDFTSNNDTAVFLQPGTNTLTLSYEGSQSLLGDAKTVTVNYFYYDYHMTIVNGKGVYLRDELPAPSGSESIADRYAGEKLDLADQPTYNGSTYTLQPGSSLVFYVKESDNTFSVYYERLIPLSAANVTVEHYVIDRVINIDGRFTDAAPALLGERDRLPAFVGETVTASMRPGDYTFDHVASLDGSVLTENGDHSVTLTVGDNGASVAYYYIHVTQDNSQAPASYTVNHYYRDIDWNQTEADVAYGAPETYAFQSFSTLTATGAPDLKPADDGTPTYALDAAEASPAFNPDRGYEITLVPGDGNSIRFYYTRHIDTRVATAVVVNHEYAVLDTYTNQETASGSFTESFNTVESGAFVGSAFQALLRTAYGEGDAAQTYSFRSASDGANDLALAETGDRLTAVTLRSTNEATVITIRYLREVSSAPVDPGPVNPDPGPGPGPVNPDPGPVNPDPNPDTGGGDNTGGNPTPVTPAPQPSTTPDQTTPDQDVPDQETPTVDIPDAETPLDDRPIPPPSQDEDTIIIVDEGTPLGDLPQTGTTRHGGSTAAMTLGLGGFISALGAGLFLKGKKQDEQ